GGGRGGGGGGGGGGSGPWIRRGRPPASISPSVGNSSSSGSPTTSSAAKPVIRSASWLNEVIAPSRVTVSSPDDTFSTIRLCSSPSSCSSSRPAWTSAASRRARSATARNAAECDALDQAASCGCIAKSPLNGGNQPAIGPQAIAKWASVASAQASIAAREPRVSAAETIQTRNKKPTSARGPPGQEHKPD